MSKAKLLVVEDEHNLLLGIRDILELDDYSVVTASNGQQALDVLRSQRGALPDLILSDIMMPYMDGLQFLEAVRKNEAWVKIPFIFLTAKGAKGDIQQGKLLGVDDYLVKPFDADDLLVAVESRLSRHQAIKQATEGEIHDIKRNILTILNHEFRTPLTLVVAYADMLKDNNVDQMSDEELLLFLREINMGADRLRHLVENFILLVELETDDAAKNYEWRSHPITNFSTILETICDRYRNHARYTNPIELVMPTQLPTVFGDREYIMTMLNELLDNAFKFSPNGDPITIEARIVEGGLQLRIIDRGRGIPPKEVENIFKSFYQVNREQFEDQGAGSGLAIVNGLARLHHAQLHVESEEGKGSCFTITFPPHPAPITA
ncbi:MAG: response regulator [Anaerolineae bacterium]|jgi:signal transduction histidine kinase|nr:response regulator [Anaerolineae bacterium]